MSLQIEEQRRYVADHRRVDASACVAWVIIMRAGASARAD
jgi:hypothetical protein